jgi:hypothetical protein
VLGFELGNPNKMVLPVVALGLLPGAHRPDHPHPCSMSSARTISAPLGRRAKEFLVVMRHAVKNALIPVLTVLGSNLRWAHHGFLHHRNAVRNPGPWP